VAIAKSIWRKGRGKLGQLDPLIGEWYAEADSPMGRVKCTRTFSRVLSGVYVLLNAHWEFGAKSYDEMALFGAGADGQLSFWSFTSDGKHSAGKIADVSDVHPQAVGFEAEMPAGLARMVYWPKEDDGFHWAVEAKNKSGWKRFTEHHYFRRSQ
jgi:hypothetical protein